MSSATLAKAAGGAGSLKSRVQPRLRAALDVYLKHRGSVQKGLTAGFVLYCIAGAIYNITGKGPSNKNDLDNSRKGKRSGKGKGGKPTMSISDPVFHARLKRLLRIVVPGIRSREAGMLALHTCFLLARTALSLYVADLDGRYVAGGMCSVARLVADNVPRIVSSLVTAQPRLFMMNLARWCAIAIPATYTNSMIAYLQSELGLAYRTR